MGYLTRYEMLAAAIAVVGVVLFVGVVARDHAKPLRDRLAAAGTDALVVGVPVATAFIAWAVVSWVITGEPFQQFTSRYGNASIIAAAGGVGERERLRLAQDRAGVRADRRVHPVRPAPRRDRRLRCARCAATAASLPSPRLRGPLAFSVASYTSGSTFGWFRYYIPVLPLALIALGLLLNPIKGMQPATPRWLRAGAPAAIAVVLIVGLTAVTSTAWAITDPHLAPDEHAKYSWLFVHATLAVRTPKRGAARAVPPTSRTGSTHSVSTTVRWRSTRSTAVPLIILSSRHPHQFVITSDRDFERVIADPLAFDVPYLLVPNGDRGIEAISLVHPGIFEGGRVGSLQTKVVADFKHARAVRTTG